MLLLTDIQNVVKKSIEQISWSNTLASGLYDPAKYVLSMGGKRLRPSLLLLSVDIFGGEVSKFVNAALAIEVFHNFTLLHDDVMDKALIRRGQPTVHVKWNENAAILSGDAMLVKAYELLADVPSDKLPKVLSLFSNTAREVCEGQQLDMEFEKRLDVREEEYLEMIRLKTAVLIAASLKIGAILGGATDKQADAMYDFGINVGLAFQLQDDMLDVYGDEKIFGKKIGGDIREKKKTYMLINAYNKSNAAQRKRLDGLMSEKDVDVAAVTEIYNEIGIRALCEKKMEEYLQNAINALDVIGMPDATQQLKEIAENLMKREV